MSKEYIEREVAKKNAFGDSTLCETIRSVLNDVPASDVEPVRHGYWIEHHGQSYLVTPMKYDEYRNPVLQDYISYECSICGRRESAKEPYCNCGTKMDKDKTFLPFGIQRSAEEVGNALKVLHNRMLIDGSEIDVNL